MFQRRAPRERVRIHISEHRLHDLGDVSQFDLFVKNLRGRTERKVLYEQEVDLVSVDIAFLRLAQMTLNQCAQSRFAGVQCRHLQEMTKFMHHDALIHRIQPFVHLAENLQIQLFWEVPLGLRKGDCHFQLLRERQIDREHRARFFPLFLPRAFRSSGSGDIQRCYRLVHDCITTQSQGPCENLTATALRPS